MKNCPVLFAAVLARVVAGQSAVTVTAPAPSAPSPAEPPFSVTIVSAAQPDTSVSVSSLTVFASPNPAPSPPTQPSIDVTTVTASPSSAASPSSDRGGSGGGSSGGGSGGGSSPGVGICGLGYTYCGYILKNHQGFPESDVVKAYCAGAADNCASGTPKTDPMNALFICLPPTSQRMGVLLPRQAPQPSSGGSGGGAAPPNGCSSTPGPGNKLHLLCSCGGQCLNPDADHIGRCDKPCA
ncbi:hypothetical protein NKR19_g7853 [Coniochaeta hoffmannii]|uniref:LysM domain-containing protein n=1 Tax=Coniochaeta hoffmannii TaxID=91930 RepID=A0AA38R962_9PEZI|nr:hypothetical protein NKR19_g7853 [Coniochaeta hoffmannii]